MARQSFGFITKWWSGVLLFLISFAAYAQVIYVDSGGSNTNGSTWESAYHFLYDALEAAQNGDEIRVAQGAYVPDQSTADPNGTSDQYASFNLKSGITLRGGYGGLLNPSDPNEQETNTYKTVLHGKDYFYHVLTAKSIFINQTQVEGFLVTGGKSVNPEHRAGGFICKNSNLIIKNCIFEKNEGEWGGAVNCEFSTIRFEDCQFIGNLASENGGAIYLYSTDVDVINCTFRRNKSDLGGAIGGDCQNVNSQTKLYNCIFLENTARIGAGLFYNSFELAIVNCTFTENIATESGGVISTADSVVPGLGYLDIANSVVWDNRSPDGIQIDLYGYLGDVYYVDIYHSVIQGEQASVSITPSVILNWEDTNMGINPLLTWDGHIQSLSPCIDNGDPNQRLITDLIDYDNEIRIYGSHMDIGADEFVDSDADGLPDRWEYSYFQEIDIYDANDNPDCDIWENAIEYARGSDPFYKTSDYFVNPVDGNDLWDGLANTWDGQHGPKATIQNAIDQTGFRDGDRVFLATGIYRGPGNRDLDYGGRSIHLTGMNPADPNIAANTIIDCEGDPNDPHRGFIFQNYENEEAVADGITIINGYADEGGAVYCDQASTPVFKRCVFRDNGAVYGGGFYGFNGRIDSCFIFNNNASSDGGGLYNCSGFVVSSSILGNSAYCGGGVAIGECLIINCTIEENQALTLGGGVFGFEGSIINSFINNNIAHMAGGITFSGAYIQNCTITNNRSEYRPAGIFSLYYDSTDPPLIVNSIIWGNVVNNGLPQYAKLYQIYPFSKNQVNSCCIQDWTEDMGGAANFSNNPQITEKYYLSNASPCLDAGNNTFW